MIETALIVDVETTGLDPQSGTVIEVGCVLYSARHQTTLAQFSRLLYAESNPCEAVNRIPSAPLREAESIEPFTAIESWFRRAEVIVAHNASFDRQWFPDVGKPWLCTMEDFIWPRASKPGQSLVSLALDHGIGVSSAHRALTDCQLIAALFDRMDDLQSMFAVAMRPKGLYQALVSYDDRQLAKDAGFRWNGDDKAWTRCMAVEDAEALPFRVRKIN